MALNQTNFKAFSATCPKCGHRGKLSVPLAKLKVAEDMAYGQKSLITATPDEDRKHVQDYCIGNLRIQYRTRRYSSAKYDEISIRSRRANGVKTEKAKILDGECKSRLFIWDFHDCWIVCSYHNVLDALRRDIGYEKPNNDKVTWAYYIKITDIKHIRINKE